MSFNINIYTGEMLLQAHLSFHGYLLLQPGHANQFLCLYNLGLDSGLLNSIFKHYSWDPFLLCGELL